MDDVSYYKQNGKSPSEISELLDGDTSISYDYLDNKVEITLSKNVELITPFASFISNPYKITTKRVLFNE